MSKSSPAALFTLLLTAATLHAAPAPSFNREIRPILAENCYHCHGPDAASRKADLRLDLPGALVDPDLRTELVARAGSHDPDEIMPPPESKRILTEEEKSLLKRWAAAGAPYEKHWAYTPPAKPATPDDPNIHPIDHFLTPQITASGLPPTPRAAPRTLIRRLSLDLTGLPPTPDEVQDFVNASIRNPQSAIRDAADRLLASPHFGEKWARGWLDLARYADSNGFQADQLRDSWAYRDWVIDALNSGMPFDQFTVEQIAGDLLPNPTLQQKIATGFHRTVTCNVEAGVDPEENRVNQVIDRVNTTGTVWLGTTLECAQCHDHKYDPFSMADYYGIFAFFNNTPLEVDNGKGGVQYDFVGPKMPVPSTPEEEAERSRIQSEIASKEASLAAFTATSESDRQRWERDALAAAESPARWHVLPPSKVTGTGGETLTILEDGSVLATGTNPETSTYTFEFSTGLKAIRQFKIEALTHTDIPGNGPGRGDAERSNFILSEFEATAQSPDQASPAKIALHSPAADFSQTGWPVANALDGDPTTGWAISPQFGKPHWATFSTAAPVGDGTPTTFRFTLDQNYGGGRVLGCVRISASASDPALDVPAEIAAILRKPGKRRSPAQTKKLDAFYAAKNPTSAKLDAELAQLRSQLANLKSPTTLIMVELDQPRETHILDRGNYLSPAEKVAPAIPAILTTQSEIRNPKSEIANRLTFARWLTGPENPLTARVTVNRWWAELFGHGIVATLEDFGTQSSPPSHPDLLDWLASECIDSGWSMKHILFLIVTSDAYLRSSHIPADHLHADPKNLLYARGARLRMPAEMVRDNALAISGLLSSKLGGKPIMPYQPPGLWRSVGRNEPKWVEDKDENRFRRGIYIVYRRAAPYPSFTNFDAPDRSACTVARPSTNTPLQALTLLNDPAYAEMALALAARILTESPAPGPESQINTAFEIALARPPTPQESSYLTAILKNRLALAKQNPASAKSAISSASSTYKPPTTLDPADLAASYHLATIILNLDESITKQ